jgi:hypothetical protein
VGDAEAAAVGFDVGAADDGEERAMTGSTPSVEEGVKLAAEAFIYGYPFVYSLDEIEKFPAGTGTLVPGVHQYNSFAHARELLGPDAEFVSPNNDTLYSIAPVDVSVGPVLLHVPDTHGRYYVLQFIDAWSNNFAYIGRRATGTEAATYLLVPWDWHSDVPDDVQHVVQAPTDVFIIGGRVQVHGQADVAAVHALQDQFTIAPLDPNAPAPKGIPEPDAGVADDLAWWERFRVALAAFPPPADDAPFTAICERLSLTNTDSPFADPDPELAQVLVAGEQAAKTRLEEVTKHASPAINGWVSAAHMFDYNRFRLGLGTIDSPEWRIDDAEQAYVTRAAAARLGLWGNHGYEADYVITYVDDRGEQLTGEHRYELRLPSAPPVDAFWSLTMYDVPDYYLVANPIDRYSIGSATPGLQTADDGSITLYLQHEPPGDNKEANWLPAPQGQFRPIMRMYAPQQDVLDGAYVLPPIRRLD